MQLTPAQRRFYIDPVQDPTIVTSKILVTEERNKHRALHIDKIVEVRKERFTADYRTWWVTTDGDYVMGAPVNHHRWGYGTRLIAPGGDGWFWLGTPSRAIPGGGHLASEPRRSDGKRLPITPGNTTGMNLQLEFPEVVRAAPWAEALFPAPTDSDDMVRAKLALAEQRWTHRNAKAEIIRQGMGRGWTEDLKELRDGNKLPEATIGAYFQGLVMIETSNATADLNNGDQARLTELRERAAAANAQTRVMVGVKVNTPLSALSVTDADDLRRTSSYDITDAVRQAVGDYTAVPTDYSLTPVLRNIAA